MNRVERRPNKVSVRGPQWSGAGVTTAELVASGVLGETKTLGRPGGVRPVHKAAQGEGCDEEEECLLPYDDDDDDDE